MLVVKNPPTHAGDVKDRGSIPRWEDLLEERAQQPTLVFLPEGSMDRGLVGCSHEPQGLDATEQEAHMHAQHRAWQLRGQREGEGQEVFGRLGVKKGA